MSGILWVEDTSMIRRTNRWITLLAAFALASASATFAAEPEKGATAAPTPEARQKMAEVHQRMADCLKSDRPMSECRAEMAKSCHDMMGASACPMMGMGEGGMGPGMMGGGMKGGGMGGGMMKGQPTPETPKK